MDPEAQRTPDGIDSEKQFSAHDPPVHEEIMKGTAHDAAERGRAATDR
jgi:hypothetical protein